MTVHLKLKFYKKSFEIEQVSLLPLNPDGLFIDIQVFYLNARYALFNFIDSESWQKFCQFSEKFWVIYSDSSIKYVKKYCWSFTFFNVLIFPGSLYWDLIVLIPLLRAPLI